jgi:hypothetical protein
MLLCEWKSVYKLKTNVAEDNLDLSGIKMRNIKNRMQHTHITPRYGSEALQVEVRKRYA